ncbi:SpoIIE family protein phosphatase [Paracoccus sp. C2R09]|nr:SpoIIE family protein phosphatase [Paracoccus sp. C2R09]
MYTSAILRKLGFEPLEAGDGVSALELLRNTAAQLLICDLDMPRMDGHELARQIRADNAERYVHILMVTGRDQRRERERALESGVDDFMAKPLDTASLTARVRSVTRLLRHEQLLADRNAAVAAAKERIEEDIRAAANAQRRLLPEPHRTTGGCTFHSAFVPSNILSGDMFAYYDLGDGLTGFYAADVAGHGVHASLLSVALGHLMTADYFRSQINDGSGVPAPHALVAALNRRFHDPDSHDYFTMFCGVIDRAADRLHYCQAGYPSPIIVSREGDLDHVGDGGFPVGLIDTITYEQGQTAFPQGHSLMLVSDGAHEAENAEGRAFEDSRIADCVRRAAREPSHIPQRLVAALTEWRAGRPLDDDLSVLVCERRNER